MKAMILAAGRGERMRPLTDTIPKPMLPVNGKPLIQYHVERLVMAGINDIVINHSWMGEKIESFLGDGHRFNASIRYSPEGGLPLETAGGIRRALPLLGKSPFIAVNADVWTDYPFDSLAIGPDDLAHLVLVRNPTHHPEGDFCLHGDRVRLGPGPRLTFAGIGAYHPDLFTDLPEEIYPLGPLLREAISEENVSGEEYRGVWQDIGTPERFNQLQSADK
ncbi:MAG: nucleotidyltransferase family protein [Gammaproteobacteria bacterium]|nr:NTP transferase domain-containing protein [Gammaproteobacteria bacterium]NIN62467.1 NTP transferase domain-containing protein [Gammaproteobacteria bacterium]NIO62850.1 NTP transferase domain-containing protein [Gammaproteobacteria bacterium]NIP49942.1 nucleotidyltransferase family protein [Gammaproteobacteria bacterium]NIQ12161.1 nucleotidyltransferase family protein [Gammaproteobacteria bacterium]